MRPRSLLGGLGCALLAAGALSVPAQAAPPPNDSPAAPGTFEPFTADNGTPRERQAVAELFEATADSGVPRCLGDDSFARTVWYRIPEAPTPQLLTVEAAGRTLDVADLAAFVQPYVAPPPPPPPPEPTPTPTPDPSATPTPTPTVTPTPTPTVIPTRARTSQAPLVSEPNACGGLGAGGGDLGEEPTSAVTLLVPPQRPVLVQVGRRGTPTTADDERTVLSLSAEPLLDVGSPRGDRANLATPLARSERANFVDLTGAAITEEDPAQPACPSLGTVWRRFVPGTRGRRLITVSGYEAMTLTVFAGGRPTGDNVLDCVNREGRGSLRMKVPTRKRRTLWIRIGTDLPPEGAEVALRVQDGRGAVVVDGGPGGSDPTPGGPGGGFPDACSRSDVRRARIKGPALSGVAGAYNRFVRVPLRIRVRGASVCDAELRLFGPKGRLYAKGRAVRLLGRRTVRLGRLRTFRRGAYRLRVTGISPIGRRVNVRTKVRGRLR